VNPSDKLVDLVYALKAGYRQNASFVMNRKTQAAIRKFKDADGNYGTRVPTAGRECEEQYERDLSICRLVGLKACYAQAAQRYSACLSGRPIPPLNF
jgi:capsid protein